MGLVVPHVDQRIYSLYEDLCQSQQATGGLFLFPLDTWAYKGAQHILVRKRHGMKELETPNSRSVFRGNLDLTPDFGENGLSYRTMACQEPRGDPVLRSLFLTKHGKLFGGLRRISRGTEVCLAD